MGTIGRTAGLATAAAALAAAGGLALTTTSSGANGVLARAELVDGTGARVGEVRFQARGHEVVGSIDVQLPADSSHFHGFHLHANNDPANGTGCVAPGFTSADGHWNPGGVGHGNHAGDLPPLLLGPDGRSRATFSVGHFDPGELIGLAVIVHAGPDNLANIPTRYSAGGVAGPDSATLGTGDAGARFACGVVQAPGG
jgi:Cu-Zn family superoxide dismutase